MIINIVASPNERKSRFIVTGSNLNKLAREFSFKGELNDYVPLSMKSLVKDSRKQLSSKVKYYDTLKDSRSHSNTPKDNFISDK